MSNFITIKSSIYHRIHKSTEGEINFKSVNKVIGDVIVPFDMNNFRNSFQIPNERCTKFSKFCCGLEFRNLELFEMHQQYCSSKKISKLNVKKSIKAAITADKDFDPNYFYCSCHFKFTSLVALNYHSRKCEVAKLSKLNLTYTCLKCVLCFNNINQFKVHLRICFRRSNQNVKRRKYCRSCTTIECHFYRCILNNVKASNSWKCTICSKGFIHPLDFFIHSKVCQGTSLAQCLCGQNCANIYNLYVHVKSCENFSKTLPSIGWNRACDFFNILNINSHPIKIGHHKNPIKKAIMAVNNETQQSNPENEIECNCHIQDDFDKVNSKFSKQVMLPSLKEDKLLKFEVMYDGTGCLKCPLCAKPFKTSWSLKYHYKKVHLPKKFTCKRCNSKFSWKTSLLNHEKRCRKWMNGFI